MTQRIPTTRRVSRDKRRPFMVTYTLRATEHGVERSMPVHCVVHDGVRAFQRTLVWRELESRIAADVRIGLACRAASRAMDDASVEAGIAAWTGAFIASQADMPVEAEQILRRNLWDLYAT